MTRSNTLKGHKPMLYALMIAAVVFEVSGDLLFRKWGLEQRWPVFVASLLIYNLAAIAWGFSLRHIQVSTAIVVLGVLNVVLVVIGGVVLYREQLSATQMIGIGLGIVCLILLGGE
jgi:spermidine export protein MdtJ